MHSRNSYFQSVQHPQLSEGVRGEKGLQQVLRHSLSLSLLKFQFCGEKGQQFSLFSFSGKLCLYLVDNRTIGIIQLNMISFLICSTTSVLLSCKRYSNLIYLISQSLSDFNLFPLSERSCSNFGIQNSAKRVNMRAWRGFRIGWTMTTTMKTKMITIWTNIEMSYYL